MNVSEDVSEDAEAEDEAETGAEDGVADETEELAALSPQALNASNAASITKGTNGFLMTGLSLL